MSEDSDNGTYIDHEFVDDDEEDPILENTVYDMNFTYPIQICYETSEHSIIDIQAVRANKIIHHPDIFYKNMYDNVITDPHNYDCNIFVTKDDYNNSTELTEQIILDKLISITSIFDKINTLVEPTEHIDNNFRRYLDNTSNTIHTVVDSMVDNPTWVFEPVKKFIWIYFVTGCLYESRVLKYVVELPDYDPNLLTMEDRNGHIYMHYVCRTTDTSVIEELKRLNLLTPELLSYSGRVVPPIMYSVLNTKVCKYILDSLDEDSFNKIVNTGYEKNITPFMFACCNNTDTALHMLNSQYMTADCFSKVTDCGMTCLMFSCLYNTKLLEHLLESDHCSEDIVLMEHPNLGNIFNIAVKYSKELIKYILESKYMSTKLFNGVTTYNSIQTNVLFETVNNHEYFKLLIESEYATTDTVNFTVKGVDILTEAVLYGKPETVNSVLKCKKYTRFTDNIIMIACKRDATFGGDSVLKIMADNNMLNSTNVTFQDHDGLNVLMYSLSIDKTVADLIVKEYLTTALLRQQTNSGVNSFVFCASTIPSTAKYIMTTEHFTEEVLSDMCSCYNLPMIHSVLAYCKDEQLISDIVQSKFCTTELLSVVDSKKRNSLLSLSTLNQCAVKYIVDSPLCTSEMFCLRDSNKDSVLTTLLKNDNVESGTVKTVVNSKFCTSTMINGVNKDGWTPFFTACGKDADSVNCIITSSHFNKKLTSLKDFNGVSCLTRACAKGDIKILQLIDQFLTDDMFEDCGGYAVNNSFPVAEFIFSHKMFNIDRLYRTVEEWLTNDPVNIESHTIEAVVDSPYFTKNILYITNSKGVGLLSYSIMTDTKLAQKIVRSKHCTSDILGQKDIDGKTPVHTATVYCDVLKTMLDSPFMTEDILASVDNHDRSMFDYLTDYDTLEYVYSSKVCTSKVLHKLKLVPTFANYNHDTFKMLINTPNVTSDTLLIKDIEQCTVLHNLSKKTDADIFFNILLRSGKCTTELLEEVDLSGDTFLLHHYTLLKTVLETELCSSKLLSTVNSKGVNLLIKLIMYIPELIKLLLNHKLATYDLLTNRWLHVNPLMLAMRYNDNRISYILNSKVCTEDIVNTVYDDRYTILTYGVVLDNYESVKELLNSSYNLQPSFDFEDVDEKRLIIHSVNSSFGIFKEILDSKYVSKDNLLKQNRYRHNVLTYIFSQSVDKIDYFINSEHWDESMLYHTDIDDDFLFVYCKDKPDVVSYMLESGVCTDNFVSLQNKIGMNCLHYFAKVSSTTTKLFINSNLCTEDIIYCKDIYGNTPLHYTVNSVDIFKEFMNSKYYSKKLLEQQNRYGKTVVMMLVENRSPIIKTVVCSDIFCFDLVKIQDCRGMNLLMYSAKYMPEIITVLDEQGYIDDKLLAVTDNRGYMCTTYACRYNGELMKKFTELEYFNNNHLYSCHTDYGSCLTVAAKYQPVAVKHILSWGKLSWHVLHTMSECDRTMDSLDFFRIGCVHNADTVRYSLESGLDLSRFLSTTYINPAVFLAVKYQPDALKYILNSKQFMKKMLRVIRDGRSCVDEAFDYQPKSLKIIIDSGQMTEKFINREDSSGYRLLHKINRAHPDIEQLNDISSINLTNYNNVYIDDISELCCKLCCMYKVTVSFTPCGHTSCVGCAFKLKMCHLCRTDISRYNYIYT